MIPHSVKCEIAECLAEMVENYVGEEVTFFWGGEECLWPAVAKAGAPFLLLLLLLWVCVEMCVRIRKK